MINIIDQTGKTTYLANNDKKTNDFLMGWKSDIWKVIL